MRNDRDSVGRIVTGLLEKTRRGEVQWTALPIAPQVQEGVRVDLPRSSVVLLRRTDGQCVLRLLNDEGNSIIEYHVDVFEDYHGELGEIIDMALRQVRKVDQTLEDVMRFLSHEEGP